MIEVETYTWPVLPGRPAGAPDDAPVDIPAGIAAELTWAERELISERVDG